MTFVFGKPILSQNELYIENLLDEYEDHDGIVNVRRLQENICEKL